MNVTPETTIATLIQGYQRDRTLVPERWPHVDGSDAMLSTLDITLRVSDPQDQNCPPATNLWEGDPTCPQVELGILTAFDDRFHSEWKARLHPEDMEAMAAVLLQEAQRARAARLS